MKLSTFVWRTYLQRKRFESIRRELEQFQALPPDQARIELGRRLLAQIRYFGSRDDALPQWREAAQLTNPDDLWSIWTELPILTKQDLQQRFPAYQISRRFGLQGIASATGGSTGEPTRYFHDNEMIRVSAMSTHYCRIVQGWQPGMATIVLWGSERDIGKSRSLRGRISSLLRNEWMVDGYRLTPTTVLTVRRLIERHAPVAIYGFSSMLEFVARRLMEQGVAFREGEVVVAWNGGEMLLPEQSSLFSEVFGVPILNFYGGRELGAMAFEPAPGKPLTVLRPYQFLEIVDEAGRAVKPGKPGRLIWTSTVCRGTPFLRYDIGDLGTYAEQDRDTSGIRALGTLAGRVAGLFRLPDGTEVNALFWNHLFKEFEEIEQFQIAVRENGSSIQVRLKGRPIQAEREIVLRRTLDRFLHGISYNILWMNELPRTRQGKLNQVVNADQ